MHLIQLGCTASEVSNPKTGRYYVETMKATPDFTFDRSACWGSADYSYLSHLKGLMSRHRGTQPTDETAAVLAWAMREAGGIDVSKNFFLELPLNVRGLFVARHILKVAAREGDPFWLANTDQISFWLMGLIEGQPEEYQQYFLGYRSDGSAERLNPDALLKGEYTHYQIGGNKPKIEIGDNQIGRCFALLDCGFLIFDFIRTSHEAQKLLDFGTELLIAALTSD